MTTDKYRSEWNYFLNEIVRKPAYWICIAFISSLSYLFDLVNRTVSIDDLARTKYFANDNFSLSGMRWGATLLCRLLSDVEYVPFIDKFLAVFFFIIGAVLYTRILYRYIKDNRHTLFLCTLFSCLYISYPIVNEIWNYNGVNYIWVANAAIAALCTIITLENETIFNWKTFACSLLLTIVTASYEASAFLYVTVVITVILAESIFFTTKKWVIKCIHFAIPLVAAVVMRYAIGFVLIRILNLTYQQNGASGIYWNFNNNILMQVKNLLYDTFINYGFKAFIYLPITIFVISLFSSVICIMILTFKKRKPLFLFLYLLLVLSLFGQSILQGSVMPYRTAQTLQFFCPVSLTFSAFVISRLNKHILLYICYIFLSFFCYRQGVFLNKTLALNNQRSDNEAAIAYNIGFQLKKYDTSKPVYFVGEIDLGEYIDHQTHPDPTTIGGNLYKKITIYFGQQSRLYNYVRIYDTSINSAINWGKTAFQDQKIMYLYLSYYGFDITASETMDLDNYDYYLQQAIDLEMEPFSVRDLDNYILVYLDKQPKEYRKNP